MAGQVHDSLVRSYLRIDNTADEFFATCLPKEIAETFKPSSLKPKRARIVDRNFDWTEPDDVLRVTVRWTREPAILLFEHQSTVDPTMALRMSRNADRLRDQALADNPGRRTLPVVIPLVLAHAQSRWSAPLGLVDLMRGHDAVPGRLLALLPAQTYFLFDLRAHTYEQIMGLNASASLRLFFLVLRYWKDRKLAALMEGWQPLVEAVESEDHGAQVLEILETHLMKVRNMSLETTKRYPWRPAKHPDEGPMLNSPAWNWRDEGYKEGIEQGHREEHQKRLATTRRMLVLHLQCRFSSLPTWVHPRIAAASCDEMEAWAARVLHAPCIDDVFDTPVLEPG